MARLYIVATPIGNLKDITLRALETLEQVDVIACEDTRHTGKLLAAHSIKKPLVSFHSHSTEGAVKKILSFLGEGKEVAYVSDAGTPGLSDPGVKLVRAVREKQHPVTPIPGPSALTTLISAAGIPGKSFLFDGFLSPKQGKRTKRLQELLEQEENVLLYESPHRIVKLLETLADLATRRFLCVGREMTKLHEELLTGTAEEILNRLREKSAIKGEFTVFIAGNKND